MYVIPEYPCNICLVKAVCNNFACPAIEEYLTQYYKYAITLSANSSLSNSSKTVPHILKHIIDHLVKQETKFTYMYKGYPFIGIMVEIKNHFYMVKKTIDDKIKILSKF